MIHVSQRSFLHGHIAFGFQKTMPRKMEQLFTTIWAFHNWGYPKIVGYGWLTIRLKWMIWGYPYFRKPPHTHIYIYVYIQYVICICMICLGISKLSFPCEREHHDQVESDSPFGGNTKNSTDSPLPCQHINGRSSGSNRWRYVSKYHMFGHMNCGDIP